MMYIQYIYVNVSTSCILLAANATAIVDGHYRNLEEEGTTCDRLKGFTAFDNGATLSTSSQSQLVKFKAW